MKKNECNIFCVKCMSEGLCVHCVQGHHHKHTTIQVRRYVYHDVVRLADIEPLMNCEGLQSYYINSAKVAFLNQRPQLRPLQEPGQTCVVCRRKLLDNNTHCSIACKVASISRTVTLDNPLCVSRVASEDSLDSTAPPIPDVNDFHTRLWLIEIMLYVFFFHMQVC